MALNTVSIPFGYYPDPTKGRPVFNGSIYIGEPDLDPTILANQKTITIRQEGVDTPSVAQPIATSAGGVPTYNGSPAEILVDGSYSMAVLNSSGAQVYYVASQNDASTLANTDKRYGPIFATVAAMTAANPVSIDGVVVDLVAGMTVKTQGRITAGDGAGAEHLIVSGDSSDGFGRLLLASGDTSVLQVSGTVNVLKYGAVGDGVTDDSAANQAAADTGLELFFPPQDFLFGSEVLLANGGQSVQGSGWSTGGTKIITATDIKAFKVTGSFVHISRILFDNTAATTSVPHVHFAGDSFGSLAYCRFKAVENTTAMGGGVLVDDGAGGIGGVAFLMNNCNVDHGIVEIKRSDAHIKNSWIWANSRPYALRSSGAVGNLVLEGCDFLPPQTTVAAGKAAVYLSGSMTSPRILGCNFDGNTSLSTRAGLWAEDGILNLLVSGCFAFGHNKTTMIIDSLISPIITGNTFTNNNLSGDGVVDILLRDTFGQSLEKPLVQGNSFTQTAAIVGTVAPAIRLDAGTTRSNVRIVDNTIHQPGAGGGYTDIEIDLVDGAFASKQAGSLAGNAGTRTRYQRSGTLAYLTADTFKTLTYGVTLAYAPRPDQFNITYASTGTPPLTRFNSAPLPSVTSAGVGFHGTFGNGTLYWDVEL